jgi:hypothetical protein
MTKACLTCGHCVNGDYDVICVCCADASEYCPRVDCPTCEDYLLTSVNCNQCDSTLHLWRPAYPQAPPAGGLS